MWKSYLRPQIFHWKILNFRGYRRSKSESVLSIKKRKRKNVYNILSQIFIVKKEKENKNRQMIEKVLIFLRTPGWVSANFCHLIMTPLLKEIHELRGMKGCLCTIIINERLFYIWNITEAKYSKIESLLILPECWIEKTTLRRSRKIKTDFQSYFSNSHEVFQVQVICGTKEE